jgi:uncharacterized protein (DUF2267 family)
MEEMVEELIRLVSNKTGISEDQARTAVEVVVNYLKENLPAPIAGQIDNVLGRLGPREDEVGSLGDIFGR